MVRSEFDGITFLEFAKAPGIYANPDKWGEATNSILSDVLNGKMKKHYPGYAAPPKIENNNTRINV